MITRILFLLIFIPVVPTTNCMHSLPSEVKNIILINIRAKQRTIEWAEQCVSHRMVSKAWKDDIDPYISESFIMISAYQKSDFLCRAIIERSSIPVIKLLAQPDIDICTRIAAPYGYSGSISWGYGTSSRSPQGEYGTIITQTETSVLHQTLKLANPDIFKIVLTQCKGNNAQNGLKTLTLNKNDNAVTPDLKSNTVSLPDNNHYITLLVAVQHNDISTVESLLKQKATIKSWCLETYCEYAQTDLMKDLLSQCCQQQR